MSFINFTPQIMINGEWLGNPQVFGTKMEAEYAAFYLMDGYPEATDYRAVETIDSVNAFTHTSEQPTKKE